MSDMTVMDGAGEGNPGPGAEAAPAATPLREVKYVQNIGRFEKGQSVADATFGPCTLVFGENGWGKSTLADLLRSLTTNNPDIVIGRKTLAGGPEQQVVMRFVDQRAVFKDGAWTGIQTASCAKTRPFRNRPQISSLDALGIRAESRVFRAAGLTSDPWAGG